MDFKAYISSGILELYALNLLTAKEAVEVEKLLAIHNELSKELVNISIALKNFADANGIIPNPKVEEKLLGTLENLKKEKIMDPADLPLINKHTEYKYWDVFINSVKKQTIGEDGRSVNVLTHNQNVLQLLITSTTDFELETHDDEYESFLILSGELLCTMGNQTIMMAKGDFMDIPLHQPHEVKLVSPVVTAILQRVKVI